MTKKPNQNIGPVTEISYLPVFIKNIVKGYRLEMNHKFITFCTTI